MTSETRNTWVVAFLVGSMTLGAAVLLWLEPPTPGWSSSTLLMAESVRDINDVSVEFANADATVDRTEYDCVITPDGDCTWLPNESHVRLLVVGSNGREMPREQAEKLLAVFGSMSQRHGLDLRKVWLHPASDARLHPELPAPAHDLCDLLVRKGIIP